MLAWSPTGTAVEFPRLLGDLRSDSLWRPGRAIGTLQEQACHDCGHYCEAAPQIVSAVAACCTHRRSGVRTLALGLMEALVFGEVHQDKCAAGDRDLVEAEMQAALEAAVGDLVEAARRPPKVNQLNATHLIYAITGPTPELLALCAESTFGFPEGRSRGHKGNLADGFNRGRSEP
jgi:hypothetical protein